MNVVVQVPDLPGGVGQVPDRVPDPPGGNTRLPHSQGPAPRAINRNSRFRHIPLHNSRSSDLSPPILVRETDETLSVTRHLQSFNSLNTKPFTPLSVPPPGPSTAPPRYCRSSSRRITPNWLCSSGNHSRTSPAPLHFGFARSKTITLWQHSNKSRPIAATP